MHEASIALSLLDIVTEKCKEEGYNRVNSIRIRIGRASGVLPEALSFAFDALKRDTVAEDAELIIESVSLGGFCNVCGRSFEVDDTIVMNCPECLSPSFRIERGFEMEMVEMDVS